MNITVKKLKHEELSDFVNNFLPGVRVEKVHVHDGSMCASDFIRALLSISEYKILEDAIKVLSEKNVPKRTLISYDVTLHDSRTEVRVDVSATQTHGYLGCMYSFNGDGEEVKQVSFEGIRKKIKK